MKTYKPTDSERLSLDLLKTEFNTVAKQLFHKQFPDSPFENYGSVIGAGVIITKKVGRTNHVIEKWHSRGMTGEDESFERIKERLEELGFKGRYDWGRLD